MGRRGEGAQLRRKARGLEPQHAPPPYFAFFLFLPFGAGCTALQFQGRKAPWGWSHDWPT